MSDNDRRLYESMLQTIDNSQISMQSLGKIIFSLKSALASLVQTEEEWINSFRSEWGELEQVYAFNLYRKRDALDSHDLTLIRDAVQIMKKMLLEKLGRVNQEQKSE